MGINMKRIFRIRHLTRVVLFCLSVSLFVSGCKSATVTNTDVRDTDNRIGNRRDMSIELAVSVADEEQEAFWQSFVTTFEEQNEDVRLHVECVKANQMNAFCETLRISDTHPDILLTNTVAEWLSDEGSVLETSLYAPRELMDDIPYGLRSLSVSENVSYGIPASMDVMALISNNKLLSDVGIEGPIDSWETLVESARQMKNKKGDTITPLGLSLDEANATATLGAILFSHHGGYTRTNGDWYIDCPGNKNALNDLRILIEEGLTFEDPLSENMETMTEAFLEDKVAMMIAPVRAYETSAEEPEAEAKNKQTNKKESADESGQRAYTVSPVPLSMQRDVQSLVRLEQFFVFEREFSEVVDISTSESLRLDAVSRVLEAFFEDETYGTYLEARGTYPTLKHTLDAYSTSDSYAADVKRLLFDEAYGTFYAKTYPFEKDNWKEAESRFFDILKIIALGADVDDELLRMQESLMREE